MFFWYEGHGKASAYLELDILFILLVLKEMMKKPITTKNLIKLVTTGAHFSRAYEISELQGEMYN